MCLSCECTESYSEYKPQTYKKYLITLSFLFLSVTSLPFLSPEDLFSHACSLLLVLSIKYESQFHDRHKNHKILCLP